ncbi:MAG: AMP-binding protein [Planctomycetota bacterium]
MPTRDKPIVIPARGFLRMCRGSLRRPKVADSTGADLTGAALLTRSLILRRLLRRHVLADDEAHVGVLLPPSAAAVVTNAALSLDRRVVVNLNYTVSSEVMNACIAQAGIRRVLTSRKVMGKLQLEIDAELVYLEDLRNRLRWTDKLIAAAQTWLMPAALLERRLGLTRVDAEDLLTIIFTSGSTGHPKGVMLTHANVGSNVTAFNQILRLKRDDVLIGILPFFHSFGYTTTLWSVLMLSPKGAYHFSPLEARQVGSLCAKQRGTIVIATPTFLRSYIRRCEPEELASLDVAVTGAEKLPRDVADAFQKRFGVRPVEGYGTTELSPVVSCNVPPSRRLSDAQQGSREGTVGQPVPGVSAKVVDLDTGEDLGIDRSGMLLIRGPNVMKGYLHQPERTAEVMRDAWYVTGDVAVLDADGFIRITGRESRFSKIGGEMVPHIRIEEVLAEVLSLEGESLEVAVTAVPHPKKGERLIVLHTGLESPPETICRQLADAGLPPIWIPSPDGFCQVEAIPVLGTGKLDLGRLKQLAREKYGVDE